MEGWSSMFCRNCGAQVESKGNFCQSCGTITRIVDTDQAKQQQSVSLWSAAQTYDFPKVSHQDRNANQNPQESRSKSKKKLIGVLVAVVAVIVFTTVLSIIFFSGSPNTATRGNATSSNRSREGNDDSTVLPPFPSEESMLIDSSLDESIDNEIVAQTPDHMNIAAAILEPFQDISAAAALLADADSGMVLFEHNKSQRHPADALTKVATLLLAVSACETGAVDRHDIVEMTESAYYNIVAMSTTQNIVPGERMTLLDLMYCAYIGEANEACNLLAEHIAGDIPAFVASMNAYAMALGCQDTNFTNSNGQYDAQQYTTAMDQYTFFREAMKHPLFVEIVGTYRYETSATNVSEARRLTNTNEFLSPNSKYYYEACTAGKTSATYEGGYSFVSFAEAHDLTLISVVLGSDDVVLEDESIDMRNLSETRRLFDWGFSRFSWRTILSTTDFVAKAPIVNGEGSDYINLRPESSITLLLDNDITDEDFIRTITIYPVENREVLYAPVFAGDILGEVMLAYNGIEYGTVFLVAADSIAKLDTPSFFAPSEDYYVTDNAIVLSNATKQDIISANIDLEQKCQGAQIVIVTVEHLNGIPSDEYAIKLFNDWGVGISDANNGMLLLLATEEYKGWLAVGAGISDAFTNNMATDYLDRYFWPDVDARNYDTAVRKICEALFSWYSSYYGIR